MPRLTLAAATARTGFLVRTASGVRKGTNGVSANGVTTAKNMLFYRGTFWVLR